VASRRTGKRLWPAMNNLADSLVPIVKRLRLLSVCSPPSLKIQSFVTNSRDLLGFSSRYESPPMWSKADARVLVRGIQVPRIQLARNFYRLSISPQNFIDTQPLIVCVPGNLHGHIERLDVYARTVTTHFKSRASNMVAACTQVLRNFRRRSRMVGVI